MTQSIFSRRLRLPALIAMFALLATAYLASIDSSGKTTSHHPAGAQNVCQFKQAGETIRIDLGSRITDHGRLIACQQYDGHPVLIYSLPEN